MLFYFIPFLCVYGGWLFVHNNISGDIGALGQIPFGKNYDYNLKMNYLSDNLVKDTLVVSYENFHSSKTSKIFTIGDSFSGQGIYGYQNYLAHILGDSIINIKRNGGNFETAISLLNSQIIDSANCQILIFEQVDRALIARLCNIDFDMFYKLPQKNENKSNKNTNEDSGLYNLTSWIRLQFFNYDNPIYKHDLKKDCFTQNDFSHTLFYYKDDLLFKQTKPKDIEKAKKNLILLNKKFSEKGIKMIFLIAADKYDVYRPFMADNSLPTDTTTDELSNLPNVCVINTKPILQEMVRNGKKDVYMVNNTHWSYKASEAVAKKLAQYIDSLEILTNKNASR